MKQAYYECHVTMEAGPGVASAIILPTLKANRWKHSAIEGDINLGPGIKHYATRQFNAKRMTADECTAAVLALGATLRDNGVTVIREKVELVVFDTRTDKVRALCDGACPECVG